MNERKIIVKIEVMIWEMFIPLKMVVQKKEKVVQNVTTFLYNTGHEMILVIRAPKLLLSSDEQL